MEIDKHFQKKPKHTIYHYTSQRGLIGILKDNCIWASKIHYLNDSSEFVYAFKLLEGRLNKIELIPESQKEKFRKKITERIAAFRRVNIFAASFSEKGDLLSQWRAYCPNSGGFSIGFKYEHLEAELQKEGFNIVPCIYDITKQNMLLDELILRAYKQFEKDGKLKNEDNTFDFNKIFIRLSSTLKDPSFREEKEWRIITVPISYTNKMIDFRVGESMIIPFYKFYLAEFDKKLSFDRIIVGPTPHPSLSKDSVRGLLFNKNFYRSAEEGEKVFLSKIPYRTW